MNGQSLSQSGVPPAALSPGELLELTLSDVDFARGVIHVRLTKTDKDRDAPIGNHVRQALLELHRQRRKGEHVFVSPKRKSKARPLVDVKKALTAACGAAGVIDFHFHDLRYTFATRLADAGVHPKVIQDLLGHSVMQMRAPTRTPLILGRVRQLRSLHAIVTNSKTVTGAGGCK